MEKQSPFNKGIARSALRKRQSNSKQYGGKKRVRNQPNLEGLHRAWKTLRKGDFVSTERLGGELIRVYPICSAVHEMLGSVAFSCGSFGDAVIYYNRAILCNRPYDDFGSPLYFLYYLKAKALWAGRQKQSARESLVIAYRLYDEFQEAYIKAERIPERYLGTESPDRILLDELRCQLKESQRAKQLKLEYFS